MLFLVPPRTAGVAFTTRLGGSSGGPYSGLNLGTATSDDPAKVRANRERVARALGVSEDWALLKQVHGNSVVKVNTGVRFATLTYEADALLMRPTGVPAAVVAADCLPIALVGGEERGVVHAGWRGLCAGVIETAVTAFEGGRPTAWIGPSIGPCHYQVGAEVVDTFRSANPESPEFWTSDGDRFRFDLRAAARWVLRKAGAQVDDDDPPCTFCDSRFYSFRRDGETGRHAVVVWR